MTGRVLGLDPGERRIGVALSDPLGIIAQPHSVIDLRSQDLVAEVKKIIAEEDVITIVIGLPVSLDGAERTAAERARAFGAAVGEATGMRPIFADERFTTSVAEAALLEGNVRRQDRRNARDKVAAAVMLQGYLDSIAYQRDSTEDGADGVS